MKKGPASQFINIYNKKKKIVLASSSPRRIAILKECGLKFTIKASKQNEQKFLTYVFHKYKNCSFATAAELLSLAKALDTIKSFHNDYYILGFDTLVVLNNCIINKPKNKKDALEKILSLSNKTHSVITGFSIIDTKKFKKPKEKLAFFDFVLWCHKNKIFTSNHEITKVKMREITLQEAKKYVSTGEPFGKAGAYAIQGKGKKFVQKIYGDTNNVIGLPTDKFFLIFTKVLK